MIKKTIFFLLLILTVAHGQEASKSPDDNYDKHEKKYRDLDFNGWKVPFVQASDDSLYFNSALFECHIHRKDDDHLKYAMFQLNTAKWNFVANPIKDSGTGGWTTTKFTQYFDLNGDGDLDLMIKYNASDHPGPNDERTFIFFHDTLIEVHNGNMHPTDNLECVALTGEKYKMTPAGWVMQK